MGHSCRTFLWDTLAGLAGLLSDTLVCHSCGTSSKSLSQAGSPIGAHTSSSPAKPFRDSSRSHANHPNVTATFTSTTTRNLTIPCACHENLRVHMSNTHKVLRLPRNVTSATPRNLTIPCACHEITLPHLKSCTKYCACQEK